MDPLWLLLIGMAAVVGGILGFRLHAFVALLAGAMLVAALTPHPALESFALQDGASPDEAASFASTAFGSRVAMELGKTAGKIAILIAMAAIIGKCLLESGAADRIVRSALRLVGTRLAPAAFVGSGFILGVPVYFDTLFYLLIPLGKSLGIKHPSEYGRYVMAIITGGTMAHSLIPPTPGPLLVAEELGVDIGTMMLAGMVLGVLTCTVGYGYGKWMNQKFPIPLRSSFNGNGAESENAPSIPDSELPPLWLSLLPIVLPVFLIGGNAIVQTASAFSGFPGLQAGFGFLGEKNLALTLSAALALILLVRKKRTSKEAFSSSIQNALSGAGIIILITSAGGAFGGVLQQTGISLRVAEVASDFQIGILPLAFLLTTLIRTAQGSATVAMITTVGIIGSMTQVGGLSFHPVYIALAIGCGSKPFPWMNDSGFWIIGRMSDMTEKETFRAFSFMISLMAVAGLIAIMIAARIWPGI